MPNWLFHEYPNMPTIFTTCFYPRTFGGDGIMTFRQNFSGGGKYEKIVGYSRAVRAGDLIFISGTTGFLEGGGLVSDTDSYAQAKKAIENIDAILKTMGCSIMDVVRTRVFVSRSAQWQMIAKAHSEAFGSVMPASSMIVCDFLDPKIQVEIEADAVSGFSK